MERELPGSIDDGSESGIACDHYHRFRSDLELCAHVMHNNAHRFSVEWSRIEPAEGVFSGPALAHYRDVARTCRELGMEPIVTLHHFTLPQWLADAGGVLAPTAPRLFARFAATVAEALGDQVRWWVTINEPAVYVVLGHLLGVFPPNHTSLSETRLGARGLLRMHAASAMAVRAVAGSHGWKARISIAHHERRIRPGRALASLDQAIAGLSDYLFNRWFLRSCVSGRVLPPMGRGERVTGLRDSLDYIGLNYYTEASAEFDITSPSRLFMRQRPPAGVPLDRFGNGIDPACLGQALHTLWNEFHLPILITENGLADSGDEVRTRYLVDHLSAVLKALDQGVDVRGYMYWTQMDNFEWSKGYSQHFGLYSVERSSMERHAKPSAAVFAEICQSRTLPAVTTEPSRAR